MRDILTWIISIILTVLLFVALFYGIYKTNVKHDDKLWNGGHCDICGGTWEYEQAVGHRTSTSYIYVCRNCGKRIELQEVKRDKAERSNYDTN